MNNSFPDFCWSACQLALQDAKAVWEEQAKNYGMTGFMLGVIVGMVGVGIYFHIENVKERRRKDERSAAETRRIF